MSYSADTFVYKPVLLSFCGSWKLCFIEMEKMLHSQVMLVVKIINDYYFF